MDLYLLDAGWLDPANVGWLLSSDDSATSFIGWHFYRFEHWHLPWGAATDYGGALGSAIPYTDSIPMMAMALKPFSALLPDHFQYHGIWILTCLLLQAAFAWLVAGTFTHGTLQRVAVALLLTASPILLERAHNHFSLMGHWVLLAAFYLSLSTPGRFATLAWCGVLCAPALMHIYLLFMALPIFAATWLRRVAIDRDLRPIAAVRQLVAVSASLVATFWMTGYFTIPPESMKATREIYGRYAFDLDSFFNPQWGSRFLPNLPVGQNAFESYAYLGLGVLSMVALAALLFAWKRPAGWKRHVPLAVAAIAVLCVAITHQVHWLGRVIYTVPVPESFFEWASIVRGSGRLSWVMYYGLIIASAACVARTFRPVAATLLLVGAVFLQAFDLEPRALGLREVFHSRPTLVPQLRDPFWEEAARRYRHIVVVPVRAPMPHWEELGLLAADHRMTLNTGVFNRVQQEGMAKANVAERDALASGRLRDDTLYVLWDMKHQEPEVIVKPDGSTLDTVVDGMRVVAPGWRPTKPP